MLEQLPYLSELGITYLHLMPIFKVPEGDNDGGYAVSSYREVNPELGTMEELRQLATELRHRGISLVLDFVYNHTADSHEWARRALAGEREFQAYYRMFPDRQLPDAYEASMPEVFTEDHPGAFTWETRLKKWIWTTFHTYQWDLNYENPEVFNRMVEEMLFLANQGVEVLRLDAVAFLWKRLGTNCQNLPEAHWIIQAFNAIVGHRRSGDGAQVRSHRAPRRGAALHRRLRVPAVLQPAAHGAALGGAGDPRRAGAAEVPGAPLPASPRVQLDQLRPLPRRHRMGVLR